MVNHAAMHTAIGRYAGLLKPHSINFPIVAERIELTGMDEGWRKVEQVFGQQWRQAQIGPVGAGTIMREIPSQHVAVENIVAGPFPAENISVVNVQDRAQQKLKDNGWPVAIASDLAKRGREGGARGIAGNAQAAGIYSERVGMFRDTTKRSHAIVEP